MSVATRREPVAVAAVALGRTITPVKWWAAAGGAFVLLEAYVIGSWLLSGKVHRTPRGPDVPPEWMRTAAHTWEAAGVVVMMVMIAVLLVRPWRQQRAITLDGLFVLAFLLLYWQDPLVNYTQHWTTFNAELINFGSWGPHVPGWVAPRGEFFAEPVVWAWPSYLYAVFGIVLIANAVMARAKARWPRLGRAGLAGICFGFVFVADLIAELLFIRFGLYSYPGAIRGISIWAGTYYQLPANEVLLMAGVFTAFASLRFFRDDRGRTVVERGVDDLRVGPRQKTTLRFLALVGASNVIQLVCLMIPLQWFSTHGGDWPDDVLNRSYLTNYLCGSETTYACPGPNVPIPRPGSLHVDPSGALVD